MTEEDIKIIPAEELEKLKECEEVKTEDFEELKEIGEAMIKYCVNNGGLGLAAPQIGINKKMFVWANATNSFQIVFNPEILFSNNKKKTNVIEQCLSYPDEHYLVERYKNIRIKFNYFDNGEFKTYFRNLSNERSFIFQHENDHINCITIAQKGKRLNVEREEKEEDK